MPFKHRVVFNVLAKDLKNAKELVQIAGDRVLVGVMVKNFPTEEAAIQLVKEFKGNNIPVSVGLGAGDPAMWKKVAEVSVATLPDHINQVFPASGYTLGRLEQTTENVPLINSMIEPTGTPGQVYISTGPLSSAHREKVTCELAATMIAEMGIPSIKFYPIEGVKYLDELAEMTQAASKVGIKIIEPTGGIDLSNVHEIVQICLENGAELVIPHLYSSLIDKETGETKSSAMKQLVELEW
ncbi:KDGP aldolase [Psychrobacillus psychrodurans]|uniref:KDGP aldolase n=1 Tax=Psychrobacillus psychrodurans TaxID=126157 RepID=UPI0008E9FF38|nr:KDGP aldolase [Psychrobacillus psychrodurans]MCZ8540528.1 KDGP aldolase [Psychrobacillus psychrodurans]SFM68373.1 2-dehydro-3-deoxy-phosphogluconate aldolase [Psychrobacillus psychrodurans]